MTSTLTLFYVSIHSWPDLVATWLLTGLAIVVGVLALRAADQVHFAFLRDRLEVRDSLLSKDVAALDEAGYVEVTKGYVGERPRTSYSLTDRGQRAFDG